jgi:hypothetical protein
VRIKWESARTVAGCSFAGCYHACHDWCGEIMNKFLLVLLLLVPALAFAKEKPSTNPADYPLTVHVQSSRLYDLCAPNCIWVQHLFIAMDGKKYELTDTTPRHDLLRVGDYKARISKDEKGHDYEYEREYEFLLTGGEVRSYVVVGESE